MENRIEYTFKFYARVVVFDKSKDKVLLLKKKSDQKIGPGAWLLPGGTVEFGEDIEISLIREIEEETNLKIRSLELFVTKKMIIEGVHWLGLYYFGEVLDEDSLKNVEVTKHEIAQFIPLCDVPDLRDYTVLQFVKNIQSNKEHFDTLTCSSKDHSMGEYLNRYVSMKMHHLIRINHECFSRVRVIGSYDRSIHVSKDEKNDKHFNFKRPTAFIDGDILYLCCFPSRDYVRHYANLVATYFHHIGERKTVSLIHTNEHSIYNAFALTNIESIPEADIILYGNVDHIGIFENQEWKGKGDFLWKLGNIKNKKVLLLGCRFSIWGDAGYFLVRKLVKYISFETFVYIGKLGSLEKNVSANQFLATGEKSFVLGKEVEWKNIFKDVVGKYENVRIGNHITCPSVIEETKEAIEQFQKIGDFIDPEIGQMARSCNEEKKQFSYLHIISDNVVTPREENLSNERDLEIPKKRKALFIQIGKIITESIERIKSI
ncbi:MAG: NUDIX hydrolase [Candidatus Moranbacteria bacterium]|nr:NUDIX hydrolase [Candidatus Moranbacteria bacterium]